MTRQNEVVARRKLVRAWLRVAANERSRPSGWDEKLRYHDLLLEESVLLEMRAIIDSVLQLDGHGYRFERETPLLGSVRELDSMSVVALITAIEERFGLAIEDDEISAQTFETVGTLVDFVIEKISVAG